ncbi:MAG: YrdB family protein [Ferruginibacter sp.]
MQIIKLINQVIAFFLEIGMFIALGYWGFQQGRTNLTKYSFAVALPIIAIILWGFFAAPKSEYRLEFPIRIIFELCLFAIASFLLYRTGNSKLAIWFAAITLVSEIIAYIFKQ